METPKKIALGCGIALALVLLLLGGIGCILAMAYGSGIVSSIGGVVFFAGLITTVLVISTAIYIYRKSTKKDDDAEDDDGEEKADKKYGKKESREFSWGLMAFLTVILAFLTVLVGCVVWPIAMVMTTPRDFLQDRPPAKTVTPITFTFGGYTGKVPEAATTPDWTKRALPVSEFKNLAQTDKIDLHGRTAELMPIINGKFADAVWIVCDERGMSSYDRPLFYRIGIDQPPSIPSGTLWVKFYTSSREMLDVKILLSGS